MKISRDGSPRSVAVAPATRLATRCARIAKAGGECITFDSLAMRNSRTPNVAAELKREKPWHNLCEPWTTCTTFYY